MKDPIALENDPSSGEQRKRLKERLKKGAAEGVGPMDFLDLLLGYSAKKGKPVCAKQLMQRFKGLRGVFDASVEELKTFGANESAAILIKLVKELAGAYLKETIMGKDVIKSPKDVLNYLNLTLSGERIEKFIAIYLNSKNEVLAIETLHEGTINQTVVYPRKAIEKAFKHNARSVIFVHNHPSGDASPSTFDRQLTKVLDRAAFAVDLIVHDHLIIGRNRHFSARENGWITGVPQAARHHP